MRFFTLLIALMSIHTTLFSQVTSAALSGRVQDEKTNETLIGAAITAVHTPTGTKYVTVSDENGNYEIANMKTGGPYSVKVSFVGFKETAEDNVYLSLGNTTQININLLGESVDLSTVDITFKKNGTFSDARTGVSTNIGKEAIEKLPSLNRSLQDMTRLTPQGAANSFAGSNYRFNNLSIDGAVSNDAFGFVEPSGGAGGSVASGTPGNLSKSQPISLDAIAEVQVAISPFDVNLGNFTGGSLNAVTRSGTNETSGSVYGFGRNQDLTRPNANKSAFHDYQSGFRLGGAIIKNRLFYFINGEYAARNEPVAFAAGEDGSGIPADIAKRVADTLQARYGYNTGGYGKLNIENSNYKIFGRLDFNINDKNTLTLRHNYLNAQADHLNRSTNILNYESQGYKHFNVTNTSVLQLKTRISDKVFNDLIVGYNDLYDYRSNQDGSNPFPHLEITYNTSNTLFAGTYREAAIYRIKQRTFEFTDNLTFYKGKHSFMVGTHNEFYNIDYYFVTPYNGRWAYSSLDNFFQNKPSRIRATANQEDNSYDHNFNTPSSDFGVYLLSVYGQDKINFSDRFKATFGFRADMPIFTNRATPAQSVQNSPVFGKYKNDYGSQVAMAPRFSFNYDVLGNQTMQLRGGSGIFNGRAPLAWVAYSKIYNGSQFNNIDYRPATNEVIPIQSTQNLQSYLASRNVASQREINLVDNNFKLPQVWRSSLGFDYKIPNTKGLTVSLEALYTKTLQDVQFKTINLKDSFTVKGGLDTINDNKPIYLGNNTTQRIDPAYTSVFLVTNTQKGHRYSLTGSVAKDFTFSHSRLNVASAYTYGKSYDIANGVRVSPQANWEWNQTLDPNNPQLSYSNFDLRHRVVSSISFVGDFLRRNKEKKALTNVSVVFTAQSGSPYTFVYAGDQNRDASGMNDLIFVPRTQADINLVDIAATANTPLITKAEQWTNLNAYIEKDDYLKTRRGQYVERNGARTPWNLQADVRVAQDLALKKGKLQISFDIINVGNMINPDWGKQHFVPNTLNSSYSLISARGIVAGKQTYQFNNPTTEAYQIDQINSRWQGQLGLRYSW